MLSSESLPRPPILPEDIQQLVDRIRGHCGKIPVAKVDSLLTHPVEADHAVHPPCRKNARNLRTCVTILSNIFVIPPSLRNILTMRISKGLSIAPADLYPADANNSNLIGIEEQMEGWSKYTFLKALCEFRCYHPLYNSLVCKRGDRGLSWESLGAPRGSSPL